ncbi:hypothetical protein RFI_06300, partial [Reticulomyxa filosa]
TFAVCATPQFLLQVGLLCLYYMFHSFFKSQNQTNKYIYIYLFIYFFLYTYIYLYLLNFLRECVGTTKWMLFSFQYMIELMCKYIGNNSIYYCGQIDGLKDFVVETNDHKANGYEDGSDDGDESMGIRMIQHARLDEICADKVSCGESHVTILDKNKNVLYGFGENLENQLGTQEEEEEEIEKTIGNVDPFQKNITRFHYSKYRPIEICFEMTYFAKRNKTIVDVICGRHHTLALVEEEWCIYAFGNNKVPFVMLNLQQQITNAELLCDNFNRHELIIIAGEQITDILVIVDHNNLLLSGGQNQYGQKSLTGKEIGKDSFRTIAQVEKQKLIEQIGSKNIVEYAFLLSESTFILTRE